MYKFKDKQANTTALNEYMLVKTLRMFEYEGLPETIPHQQLEKFLQKSGYAFITEVEGMLYAFTGGLGGVPDVYGNPTEIVIANPALGLNKTFKLTEGVLFTNDDLRLGLFPLFDKYHTFIIENDINMVLHGYATRMNRLISAPDETTRESAQRFIDQSIDGNQVIVGENIMFDGVRVQSSQNNGPSITDLIEYSQYLKTTLNNEVGLAGNSNLKRERLITAEVEQNDASLFPLVYNMMANRLEALEKFNTKYNMTVKVNFGSVWADKHREMVDDVVDLNTGVDTNEHILENNPDSTGTGGDSTVPTQGGKGNTPESGNDESGRDDSTGTGDSEGRDPETVDTDENPESKEETEDNLRASIEEVTTQLEDTDLDQSTREDFEKLLEQYKQKLEALK